MRHGIVGAVLGCCVLIVAVALEAGAPEGRPPQKGPAPNLAGVKAMRDLEYAKPGGKPQLLDLFVPEKADGPLPLIVWIHGGAWLGGSKNGTPAMGQLRRGYAVASINYRLSQEAIFPAQIHDCKAAIRWLRAHAKEYNIDPKRIGVWGSSAGGHLVALVGTSGDVKELEGDEGNLDQSSRVQAVCDWFGPTDFCQMAAHAMPDSKLDHDAAGSPESKLIGGPIQENKDKVAKANPITYVSKDDPPFLIMHGDKDPLVPHHQSEILAEALRKAGVQVTFETVKGAGHGFGGPEVTKTVEEFFDKHLKAPAKP
ncbi:MAG: alpha/beta hydrolase [Planctomycetota bacterium]|nr:alpha/beta hydrolase [Planctomycetota bacterium]